MTERLPMTSRLEQPTERTLNSALSEGVGQTMLFYPRGAAKCGYCLRDLIAVDNRFECAVCVSKLKTIRTVAEFAQFQRDARGKRR